MTILVLVLGALSGVCIATGVIFLFTGLRRPGRDRVQILFALFAFSYAGAILTSVFEYKTTKLDEFMRLQDWTAIFVVLTLIFLFWFVSSYTKVRPLYFLIGLTLVLGLVGIIAIYRPTSVYGDIFGIVTATLPWGDEITLLDASEGAWEIIFFLTQLTIIGFLIFACGKQWRRGERQDASMLGFGLLFLILALVFDMLFIDSGAINFIYLSDYGFIPLLVIMSLHLSNQVIRIDEELFDYRQTLEQIVAERTYDLEKTASALRKSERQTRALLDAPPDTAMLLAKDGEILATNQIGAVRLELAVDSAVGKNFFDYFEPDVLAARKNKQQELILKKQPVEWEDQRAGRFYHNRMYPIVDDNNDVESVAVFAADITEQKQLQEQEKETVAIEERSRLARDLHDAVTQTIYSASLIAEVLPQVWERNPEEGQRNLKKLRSLVRSALAEMRTMLFELRPATLESANVKDLLWQLGDALYGRTRIPVKTDCDENLELPASVKIGFYRIAQEATNNISKHSKATQVQIELREQSGQVILRISDNGRGFDPVNISNGGFGLEIMQERAESIKADLEIDSQINQGTQVTIRWEATIQHDNEG